MFVHQSAIIKFGQSTALASRENPATLDRNPQTAEREREKRKMEHFAAFVWTLLFFLLPCALSQSDGNPNVSDDKNIFQV